MEAKHQMVQLILPYFNVQKGKKTIELCFILFLDLKFFLIRYDPKANQWTMISSLFEPREGLSISNMGSKSIFIAGGFNGKNNSNEFEK